MRHWKASGTSPRSRCDRQHRGMATARAFAHHGDVVGVRTERGSIGVEPFEACIIVFDRPRIGGFGGEAVIHRDRDAIQFLAYLLQAVDAALRRAQHIAAAMRVEDGGAFAARFGVDDVDRHIGVRFANGDDAALPRHIGKRWLAERTSAAHCFARFGERRRSRSAACHGKFPDHRHCGTQIGMHEAQREFVGCLGSKRGCRPEKRRGCGEDERVRDEVAAVQLHPCSPLM